MALSSCHRVAARQIFVGPVWGSLNQMKGFQNRRAACMHAREHGGFLVLSFTRSIVDLVESATETTFNMLLFIRADHLRRIPGSCAVTARPSTHRSRPCLATPPSESSC